MRVGGRKSLPGVGLVAPECDIKPKAGERRFRAWVLNHKANKSGDSWAVFARKSGVVAGRCWSAILFPYLLYRYAFGQITGLIHIAFTSDGDMIGQQL
jgi:hypothetical protein